jgi:hypothetical protein
MEQLIAMKKAIDIYMDMKISEAGGGEPQEKRTWIGEDT